MPKPDEFDMKNLLLFFLILSVISCANTKPVKTKQDTQQELGCGMLYGKNHTYFLCAPDAWVLDNKSGANQGLHAVFYPVGGYWQHSPVVTDVSLEAERNQLIEWVKASHLDLNVVVNNAGVQERMGISDNDFWERATREIDLNLKGDLETT